MSIRFNRKGSTDLKDHNELKNVGVRPHEEIDSYLDEIDEARGSDPSLSSKLGGIKQSIAGVELKNTEQDKKIEELERKINESNSSQEVINARTDLHGRMFPSLKSRIDDLQRYAEEKQGGGGGGGDGSTVVTCGYLLEPFEIEEDGQDIIKLTRGSYLISSGELEVFRGGQRLRAGSDYEEVNSTTVRFFIPLQAREVVAFRIRDRAGLTPFRYFVTDIESDRGVSFTSTTPWGGRNRHLEVYVNGQFVVEGIDYYVTSSTTITFYRPVTGTVTLQVVDRNYSDKFQLTEVQITNGRAEYSLTEFTYTPGKHELEVYLGGIRQVNFIEVDRSTIRFPSNVPEGIELWFIKESNQHVGSSVDIRQYEVQDIVATPSNPYMVDIPFETRDFRTSSLNVLKHVPGQDISREEYSFDTTDKSRFEDIDDVIFDGSLKLRTSYSVDVVEEGEVGDKKLRSFSLTLDKYKQIERVEVR